MVSFWYLHEPNVQKVGGSNPTEPWFERFAHLSMRNNESCTIRSSGSFLN